jgi:hypothetical protein
MAHSKVIVVFLLLVLAGSAGEAYSQDNDPQSVRFQNQEYQLYPHTLDAPPDISSPFVADDGTEVLLAALKDNQFALIPVTVENGAPLLYSYRIDDLFGKDKQLQVAAPDFPTLAKTGLHSEAELDAKETITGFPLSLITYIGRPGRFAYTGFMADDEDILSVLKSDNRLVERLGLTHPQMARPLFHVWNMILKEIELGNWGRFWDHIPGFTYNGRQVAFTAEGGKGWQISIFQDEIKGRYCMKVHCDLSAEERAFLEGRYAHLGKEKFDELERKLSHFQFSEMAPYYIMRYGFYEGHTDWRPDPIAIAVVFGLKSLEEIEQAFSGDLYGVLTDHFTEERIGE